MWEKKTFRAQNSQTLCRILHTQTSSSCVGIVHVYVCFLVVLGLNPSAVPEAPHRYPPKTLLEILETTA